MFAVHLDMIRSRIDLGAEFRHDLAVDRHTTGGINSSAFRRDASPVPAINFCNLISIVYSVDQHVRTIVVRHAQDALSALQSTLIEPDLRDAEHRSHLATSPYSHSIVLGGFELMS